LNFFSDAMFVFCLRSWLIIFATAIVPLFRINQIHFPLAQTLVVDLFQMFIDDETCIEAFHHYITNYRIKGAEFGSASTYAHDEEVELFRAFMYLRQFIIMQDDSEETVERLYNHCIKNENIAKLFPIDYTEEIKRYKEDFPEEYSLRTFEKLHAYCICYF